MTEAVRGLEHTAVASFTRPNDTNPYSAGDVANNSTTVPVVLTFAQASLDDAADKAGGIIQSALIIDSANQATKPDLELWIFDTTVVADNDNAAFTPTDAELLTLVGVIPFPSSSFKVGDATAGAGGNSVCHVLNVGLPFNTAGANNNALFAVLVVRNAYTPVAQEQFQVRLTVLD